MCLLSRDLICVASRPIRMTQQQKDAEEIITTGRTIWRPVPKDKHILRMYISAALSVFADVMRPCLEKKLNRLLMTFAETVEEMLPYWDTLSDDSKKSWARRAKDVGVTSHYIYLRIATAPKPPSKKSKEQLDLEDSETDPDELPGEVCQETTLAEEKLNAAKPLNWVTGGRHLMPRKTTVR